MSSVELSDIAECLSVGLSVYDRDGVRLGEIAEFDAHRRIMVIGSDEFSPVYRS